MSELQQLEESLLGGLACVPEVTRLCQEGSDDATKQVAAVVLEVMNFTCAGWVVDQTTKLLPQPFALEVDLNTVLREAVGAKLAEATPHQEVELHLLGVACLNLFVQSNFTGPQPDLQLLYSKLGVDELKMKTKCVPALSLDGEDFWSICKHGLLLVVARAILVDNFDSFKSTNYAFWWALRCAKVHNKMLSSNSQTLHSLFERLADEFHSSQCVSDPALFAKLSLEFAEMWQGCWKYAKLHESLEQAKKAVETSVELTGIMGKRTKWQREEKAQCVALVSPGNTELVDMKTQLELSEKFVSSLPKEEDLDNDVLLKTPTLTTEDGKPVNYEPLSTLDQAITLAVCENVRSNPGSKELTNYEMLAYLNRVLTPVEGTPRSYAVQMTALCRFLTYYWLFLLLFIATGEHTISTCVCACVRVCVCVCVCVFYYLLYLEHTGGQLWRSKTRTFRIGLSCRWRP